MKLRIMWEKVLGGDYNLKIIEGESVTFNDKVFLQCWYIYRSSSDPRMFPTGTLAEAAFFPLN